MTLQKLSAGSGYEYLTRQVAALDSTEKGGLPLADYYAAKGESPGCWVGAGLTGIDDLEVGDIVTAEQMKHLFGTGSDPVSGRPLGSAYRVFSNETAVAFNAKVDELLAHLATPTPAERATARSHAARELFVAETGREPDTIRELSAALARYSRPRQTAVAGFDLTFSPVKSVSALWAVAPPEVATRIEQAHDAAVADALGLPRAARDLHPRGHGRRPPGRDPRPDRRRVHPPRLPRRRPGSAHPRRGREQGADPRGQVALDLRHASCTSTCVAASETYNTALERHLVEALGVQFVERPGVDREKRPVREIDGVDRELCERVVAPASRHRGPAARADSRLPRAHGRPPTPVEAVALAQQANLETREAKHEPRSEAEQRTTWRGRGRRRTRVAGRRRPDGASRPPPDSAARAGRRVDMRGSGRRPSA